MKFHLLPFSESEYLPGEKRHFFIIKNHLIGITICKDMDFTNPALDYGRAGVELVLLPALDFRVDAWQHAKPAIIRGVEGGYTVARNAQSGLMSVTDAYGRIISFQKTDDHVPVRFLVDVPLYQLHTFYSQHQDWIIYFCLCITASLLLTIRMRNQ